MFEAPFKIYRVGGSVRDELLGLRPNDMDFTAEATAEQFRAAFPGVQTVGKRFPVFIVDGHEVALTRTERSTGPRTADVEITALGVSLLKDLGRRDFTINSMARDCQTGALIDPFNGLEDLNNRKLRTVFQDAFLEDPIRILRGCRLATKLGFTFESRTAELIYEAAHLLEGERKEMIVVELEKMYEQCEKPSEYFYHLAKLGALEFVCRPLFALLGVIAGPVQYHHDEDGNEITAFDHTMYVIDRCKANGYSFEVFIACLAHDFGKATTPKDILPHHYGHEMRSAGIANEFFENHRFTARTRKLAIKAAKHHMNFHWLTKMKPLKIVRFLRSLPRDLFFELIEVANCDHPLTKEQTDVIFRFLDAVKSTPIEIPERIKKDGKKISEFIDNEITRTFKQLTKGE